MKLYIAYGSNLNVQQMHRRCPDARLFRTGLLNNWILVFRGSKTGAYATIKRKQGSMVPVAIWKISDKDELNLDKYEGYPVFYHKQNAYVLLENGSRIKGMMYVMRKEAIPGKPSKQYIKTIAQGYIDTGLDWNHFEEFLLLNDKELQRGI